MQDYQVSQKLEIAWKKATQLYLEKIGQPHAGWTDQPAWKIFVDNAKNKTEDPRFEIEAPNFAYLLLLKENLILCKILRGEKN